MGVVVSEVESAEDRAACLDIRRRVFVTEQAVPERLELDGRDDESTHFLARRDGVPVGCARMRAVSGKAKAERVAVLASERQLGVGRALMEALESCARRRGLSPVVLHAQLEAVPFYEELGYAPHGAVFQEAGIPHLEMEKPVSDIAAGGS